MTKTTKQIEENLIRRCRDNDREAQFELYKIFYKPMYNTSLRILNNTAEAEDIMQESFLDAFRKIDDYTGEGNFGGWLRRIVVNNCLDALKKRKPEFFVEGQENFPEKPAEESPENTKYRVEEIKKAMLLLPEDHRVVLSLLLFEGYDHEETSQILGISYGASRTRYSRARQKLQDILSDQRRINVIHPN